MVNQSLLIMSISMLSCVKQPLSNPEKKIVMLGDSQVNLIDGSFSGGDFSSTWNELLGSNNTVKLGFNGYTAQDIATFGSPTPLEQTVSESPDIVYLMIGDNDALTGVSLATTMNYIDVICTELSSQGIPFVVMSLFPLTYALQQTINGGSGLINPRMYDITDSTIAYCDQQGYEFLDLRTSLCYISEMDGLLYLKDEYSQDGLHLNWSGYNKLAVPLSFNINTH